MLENEQNVDSLNDFFYHFDEPDDRIPVFETSIQELVKNEKLVHRIGRRLNSKELKEWTRGERTDDQLSQDFQTLFLRAFAYRGARSAPSVRTDEVYVQLALLQFYDEWTAEMNSEIGRKARFFGFSCFGLCTSQRIVRLSKDNSQEKVEMGNWLLTFSLGYQQSWKNELSYPESHGGSRTVRWFTFYPALEWRFGLTQGQAMNFFVNAGPALHYFWGEAFDVFPRVSPRARAGLRYKAVSVGAQVDRFLPGIEHAEFGSTDPGDHDIGYGFFFGFEFPGVLWNR
jgi:hypothetical protein